MKLSKVMYITILLPILFLLSRGVLNAATYDFILTNDTTLKYTTGQEYITVQNQFTREVKNSKYYVSTSGEKTFHIPDILSDDKEAITQERNFKKSSITVKSNTGKDIEYSIEELESGKGMYIKVPNYKETKYGTPYIITLTYNTHDFIKKVFNSITIEYPALSEDTQFEQRDESTNTVAQINYNISFEFDKNISPLVKVYPSQYLISDISNGLGTKYSFTSQQRLGNPIYIEFGTEQIYRFELSLKTVKTDTIIPEKYSSTLPLLSTNIYNVSLPREFEESNQSVKIEKISPTPTQININEEGNISATFEVPANQDSFIQVSGYIWVEQKSLTEKLAIPNPTLSSYKESIKNDSNLTKYLLPTKYWEVNDSYIQQEAKSALGINTSLLDAIKSVYTYVNERLEYDDSKAKDLTSKRIGAKAALQGGPSVCMEYSDSMIAILRELGIPSRAALGYTSLDTTQDIKVSHQWVQVWIPNYGWLSIDPTYESPNMVIGPSIQYVLWSTFFDNNITDINVLTANTDNINFDPNAFEVKVYAVDKNSIPTELTAYSEIETSGADNSSTEEYINILVKTTPLGKSLLIVLPIMVVLALLIILLSLISLLIKRLKAHRASPNQPL